MRVQPGGTGQHQKNDAEGADRAERRAEQEAQQAAQEEDPQDEVGGIDPLQRMMDDQGEGAAGPPDGGEHTDEPEDNQDIPHAADAGPQHEGNVARRVPLPQGVPGETGSPSRSAHKTLAPVRTHTARPPRKTLRTMAFTSGSLASVWMRRT